MATQIKMRRGTTSQHSSFTGSEAEVTIDTDKEVAVVHNGSTAGGFPLARADQTLALAGGTMAGTFTVGVDDTGYDVKFFGDTASAYMLWDASADDLILGGAAGLSVNSTALVTGVLTTTAATVHTNGITMPDNAKAIFGAGSDLQIYHDGSNSYIKDAGTGVLIVETDGTGIQFKDTSNDQIANFNRNGGCSLYYDNALKIATTATGISVTGTATATADFKAHSSSSGDYVRMYGGSGTGKWDIYGNGANLRIGDNESAGYVQFDTKVGIGTASPETTLEIKSTGTSIAGLNGHILVSDETAMAANVGGGVLLEGNYTTAGDDAVFGAIKGLKENGTSGNYAGALAFYSRANGGLVAERMRLDASGHLLIGKTADDNTTTGTAIHDNGFMSISRSANIAMILDRSSNEGEILRLTEAGTERGSLHINGDRMLIDSAGDASGLRFDAAGYTPFKNGSAADGTVDLGFSGGRFKDLYLSGGAYLGGTGAANKLTDYEFGTWTPTISFGGAAVSLAYGVRYGRYTKVGNVVHLSCYVGLTNKGSSTGQARVEGLPFAAINVTGNYQAATFWAQAVSCSGFLQAYVPLSQSYVILQEATTGGTNSDLANGDFANDSEVMINVSYATSS